MSQKEQNAKSMKIEHEVSSKLYAVLRDVQDCQQRLSSECL